MARLYSCGFELAGTVAAMPTGYEIHAVGSSSGPMLIQTTTKRSGSYALQVGQANVPLVSASTSYARFQWASSPGTSGPFFARFYANFNAFPSAANIIARFGGSANSVYCKVDNTGAITLWDEDGQISVGGSGQTLALNVWYRIEMHFDGTGAANLDTAKLYVDGTQIYGSTTRDITATAAFLDIGANIGGEANTAGIIFYDDVAINDNTGTAQTSLAGAGSIIHLWPDGEGDADTVVTRSGAGTSPTGTDRGTNYKQLGVDFDKPAPNDQTDFLLLTGTTSDVHVDIEAPASAGISTNSTITLVAVGARIAGATATSANWIPKIKSQSGGSLGIGATVVIASAAWNTHDDTAAAQLYKLTQYVDPQGGGAWTKALLDTTQIVAATTDGAPDTCVTALWALVEFIPVPSAPFPDTRPKIYPRRKVT